MCSKRFLCPTCVQVFLAKSESVDALELQYGPYYGRTVRLRLDRMTVKWPLVENESDDVS